MIVGKSIALRLLSIFRKNKLKSLQELNNSQWLSLSEIKEMQNRKFLKLINHCKENVPYYKKIDCFSKVKSLDDIIKLPWLTKKIIEENYEDLKATNYPEKRFVPNSTSGSTGETLRFFKDAKDTMGLGLLMRNNMWTGWKIGERQVMLWGSHYDISQAQKLFNKIKNLCIHKILYLSSYDMTEEDMLVYQKKINKYKPQLITAYPTGLFIFASFLEKRGLSIYKPKGIICSGETLYKYQKKQIESIFNCKVFNRYGCREVGNIAHQCDKQAGLHINAEHIIAEVIDENGNPCKPGELGEIVVTDLDNYVFPFVRYKIGDIGKFTDKICSCGRGLPLIEKIEGRIFDVIIGTNGNYVTGNFWTILLRTFIKGIKQFQVIQESRDILVLKLIADKNFNDVEEGKLVQKIHEKCGENMDIKVEIVDKIPLTGSGKHRFIISKVSPFVKNTE